MNRFVRIVLWLDGPGFVPLNFALVFLGAFALGLAYGGGPS